MTEITIYADYIGMAECMLWYTHVNGKWYIVWKCQCLVQSVSIIKWKALECKTLGRKLYEFTPIRSCIVRLWSCLYTRCQYICTIVLGIDFGACCIHVTERYTEHSHFTASFSHDVIGLRVTERYTEHCTGRKSRGKFIICFRENRFLILLHFSRCSSHWYLLFDA